MHEIRTRTRQATTRNMPRHHPWGRHLHSCPLQAVSRTRCQGGRPTSVSHLRSPRSQVTGRTTTRTWCACIKMAGSSAKHRHRCRGVMHRWQGHGVIPSAANMGHRQAQCSASSYLVIQACKADHHLRHVICTLLRHLKPAPLRGRRRNLWPSPTYLSILHPARWHQEHQCVVQLSLQSRSTRSRCGNSLSPPGLVASARETDG